MRLTALIVLFFFFEYCTAQTDQRVTLLQKMLTACESVHSARYTMDQSERLPNGKISYSQILVKLKYRPKSVYMYMVKPNPGAEALWINDRPDAKVLISPGGFPYVNVRFNTHSSLLRQDSHHTIEEVGFEQITAMIRYFSGKLGDQFLRYLSIVDTVTWDNHFCIQIQYDYPLYHMIPYKVKKGETITSIASANFLNDYALLQANPGVRNYDSVKEGQVIQMPDFYCRKLVFYIDRQTFLPVRQLIYDQKGLFEQYEIKSLILNPAFQPDEFTEGYKDYKF